MTRVVSKIVYVYNTVNEDGLFAEIALRINNIRTVENTTPPVYYEGFHNYIDAKIYFRAYMFTG